MLMSSLLTMPPAEAAAAAAAAAAALASRSWLRCALTSANPFCWPALSIATSAASRSTALTSSASDPLALSPDMSRLGRCAAPPLARYNVAPASIPATAIRMKVTPQPPPAPPPRPPRAFES